MTHPFIQESIDRRPAVRQLLSLPTDDYVDVRELWKAHSKAEDARDIAGLMATLTDDCVYELVQTGHSWEGHEGATRFYTELLTAFPDIYFSLTSIVVGPQGVCEEAVVEGGPHHLDPPDGRTHGSEVAEQLRRQLGSTGHPEADRLALALVHPAMRPVALEMQCISPLQHDGPFFQFVAKPAFEHIAKVGAARRRQNNDSWCAGNLKGQPLAVCPRARGLRSLPQRTDSADGV